MVPFQPPCQPSPTAFGEAGVDTSLSLRNRLWFDKSVGFNPVFALGSLRGALQMPRPGPHPKDSCAAKVEKLV